MFGFVKYDLTVFRENFGKFDSLTTAAKRGKIELTADFSYQKFV